MFGLKEKYLIFLVTFILDEPSSAVGILFGVINDIKFGGSPIYANVSKSSDGPIEFQARIENIPPTVG